MTLILDEHPSRVAERLTGRDYVSWSSLTTFQACPLKWHFRYVLGLPERAISFSLVFGGAIHGAVEHHFRELLAGNPPPDLDTLLAAYQDAWRSRDPGAVKFGKGEDVDSLGQLAERMLAAFQASELACPAGAIIGVEEELRGQISPDCPDLLGRVDLLVDAGDELVLTDLKTARSRWSPRQAEDNGEQLLLYGELARELLPGRRLRLEFGVVTKGRSPVVETLPVAVDPGRVRRTRTMVEQTWKAMRSDVVYPSPSPMNCGGCPYRAPCSEWEG